MNFKFEGLIIWQKAMDYGEIITELAHEFPKRIYFRRAIS